MKDPPLCSSALNDLTVQKSIWRIGVRLETAFPILFGYGDFSLSQLQYSFLDALPSISHSGEEGPVLSPSTYDHGILNQDGAQGGRQCISIGYFTHMSGSLFTKNQRMGCGSQVALSSGASLHRFSHPHQHVCI